MVMSGDQSAEQAPRVHAVLDQLGKLSGQKKNSTRPMFLEYDKPTGRERRYCCYKDDPCPTHASVLGILCGGAIGQIDPVAGLVDFEKVREKSLSDR
jgi:hypothetical protein